LEFLSREAFVMTLIELNQLDQDVVCGDGVRFSGNGHYFKIDADADIMRAVNATTSPLSVILQVTRRCNFDCDFCSETAQIPDPTLEELDVIRRHLAGTKRVFLSGGEPLLRRDFPEIVDMYRDFIIGVPTNAVRGVQQAEKIAGKIAYVNIGLEGPRAITNRVRGDYDKVMKGVWHFKAAGIPLALSAVVLRSNRDAMAFTCQIGDVIGAGKIKMIMPIRRGNSVYMPEEEFLSLEEADALFEELVALKKRYLWTPSLRMTTWRPETEGYMILVYPNADTYAWPVYDADEKVLFLGNLKEETIQEIWTRYPYKLNHYRKYLGKSINVAEATTDYRFEKRRRM
jgi:MoaA/NifB/PqqE/SkfB family radical SAM enzyme